MQVTVTLFLQMGNFLIAWFLLHTFYFKPAIAVLEGEQRHEDECLKRKDALRAAVQEKEQEMSAQWRKLKHFAGQHAVELSTFGSSERMHAFRASEQPAAPGDDIDMQEQVARMKEAVTAEVLRVNL